MKNIAVAGCGYWGKNLVRNFHKIGVLGAICDANNETLAKTAANYPGLSAQSDFSKILSDNFIEGVVIATPASEHFKQVKAALEAGKHVLVEKPFATSYAEAEQLAELADKKKLTLMVGFTFIYNAAVRKIKEMIDSGELGEIYYVYSQRLNLGIVRKDVNVWWNLAPHDISIINYWFGQKPVSVSGWGLSFIQKGIEDVVTANINFGNGTGALVHVSWLDPAKLRKMVIIGSKKMVVYDDVSADMKVQVFDKGIDRFGDFSTFSQFQLISRAGDIHIPKIDFKEPLEVQGRHFIDCMRTKAEPMTSAKWSLPVVKVLEAVTTSIKEQKTVKI